MSDIMTDIRRINAAAIRFPIPRSKGNTGNEPNPIQREKTARPLTIAQAPVQKSVAAAAASYINKARELIDGGNYEEGLKLLDLAIASFSGNSQLYEIRGDLYCKCARFAEAADNYLTAFLLSTDDKKRQFTLKLKSAWAGIYEASFRQQVLSGQITVALKEILGGKSLIIPSDYTAIIDDIYFAYGVSLDEKSLDFTEEFSRIGDVLKPFVQSAGGLTAPEVFVLDSGITSEFSGGKVSGYRFSDWINPTVCHAHMALDSPGKTHGSVMAKLIHKSAPNIEMISINAEGKDAILNPKVIFEGLFKILVFSIANPKSKIIVNSSFGSNTDNTLMRVLTAELSKRGAVVVAAAGNNGNTKPWYPAAFPGVLSAAGLGKDGRRDPASNYGSFIGIAAAGWIEGGIGFVEGDMAGNVYQVKIDGTSVAAARVSGLISQMCYINQSLSPNDAARIVMETSDPINDEEYKSGRLGRGALNPARALEKDMGFNPGQTQGSKESVVPMDVVLPKGDDISILRSVKEEAQKYWRLANYFRIEMLKQKDPKDRTAAFEEAIRLFEKASGLYPGIRRDPIFMYSWARTYLDFGAYDEALEKFVQSLSGFLEKGDQKSASLAVLGVKAAYWSYLHKELLEERKKIKQ